MLNRRLARLAFRLRLRRALAGALAGLAWGLGGAIVLLAVGKFTPLGSPALLAGGAVAAGVLAGTVAGFARSVSLKQAAALADLGAGSAEVISTAFETPEGNRFGAEIHARAEAVLNGRRDAQLLPRRTLPRPWRVAALALVLAALVPIPAITFSTTPGGAPATLSPVVLKALERSAKEMKRIGDQTSNPEVRQIGEEMQRMAASVRLGEMSKKEALAKIAALTDRAEEARQELEAKTEALRALARNPETRPIAAEAARGNPEGAQSRAGELAKKVESGALDSERLEALKETLQSLAKEGRGDIVKAAAATADALLKKDPKELADKLEKVAKALKGAWVPEEMLDGPAQELAAGKELAAALKGLEDAEGDLMTEEEVAAALKGFCPDCGKKKEACKGGT